MLSKAKKKMYTAYLGVLPVGYYFNGTYACPPNEHKSTERANFIYEETPIVCLPDGSIQPFIPLSGYFYNDEEVEKLTLLDKALQVEHGVVTNKRYKKGHYAVPWFPVIFKPEENRTYSVRYDGRFFYVKEYGRIHKYSKELFKTMFNNRGFEQELEDVGTLDFTPEPLFQVKKSSDADFADKIMYKLQAMYDKSFLKLTVGKLPTMYKKDANTVVLDDFEITKGYKLMMGKEVVIQEEDKAKFFQYVTSLLGFYSNNTLHSFLQEPMTNEEYHSIHQYTTDDYMQINDFLRKENNAYSTFSHYMQAIKIHEVLQKCRPYKDIFVLRGIATEKYKDKIKEDYILEDNGFKSTTFSLETLKQFGTTLDGKYGIFCLINCKIFTRSLYVGEIAACASEYETLVDFNYDLKFVKELGTYDSVPVWYCEFVKNPKKIENYLYQPDNVEKVLNVLAADNTIKNLYYIMRIDEDNYDRNRITVSQIFKEDNEIDITFIDENKISLTKEFEDLYLELDMTQDDFASKLLKTLYDLKLDAHVEDVDLWQMNQRIMQNLISILLANNIVISSQELKETTAQLKIYVDNYQSMNDLETLIINFKYTIQDKKVYLQFECNLHGDIHKSTKGQITNENIGQIGTHIYNYLMNRYLLNGERRLKHIVKLVGGYYMSESNIEKYGNGYQATIGDRLLIIKKVGNTLRANNLEFNYADNIYDIASAIKDELNIKP